jgi:hypothetical protein
MLNFPLDMTNVFKRDYLNLTLKLEFPKQISDYLLQKERAWKEIKMLKNIT